MSEKSYERGNGAGKRKRNQRNNDTTEGGFIRASPTSSVAAASSSSTASSRKRRIPPSNTTRNSTTVPPKPTTKRKQKVSNPNNAPYVNENANDKNDVPQIKGVSPSITPLLLATIKAYKKYFTKLSKLESHNNHNGDNHSNNNTHILHTEKDEKEDILNRIKQQNDQKNSEAHKKITDLQLKSHDAMKLFIKSLKQEMMLQSSSKEDKKSVAVSSLFFCLNLLQDPSASINLCCAVIQVVKELLKRGSDCRAALFSDDTDQLKLLVDAIAAKRNDCGNDNDVQMFQKEALEMLQNLNDTHNNKGEYPRLQVAMRYLEERKGILLHSLSTTGGGSNGSGEGNIASKLRHERDVAIQYGTKQEKVISKIMKRMNICFDVLVPRLDDPFGVDAAEAMTKFLELEQQQHTKGKKEKKMENANDAESSAKNDNETSVSSSAKTKTTQEKKVSKKENDDESSDDDDIDWEEGDEVDIFGINEENGNDAVKENKDTATTTPTANNNITEAQHKDAVEQTLAVMESTGGIVGGEMEINFDMNQTEDVTYQTNNLAMQQQSSIADETAVNMAKATLQKCVNHLSYRYMPRLSVWVDALITADGLTTVQQDQVNDVNNNNSNTRPSPLEPIPTSLVLLSPSMRKKRKMTLQKLMSLKADVASALSSAGRLGIVPGGNGEDHSLGNQKQRRDDVNATIVDDKKASSRSQNTSTHHLAADASSSSTIKPPNTGGLNPSKRYDTKTAEASLHKQNWKAALGLSTTQGGKKHDKGDGKPCSLKHRLSLQGKGIHARTKKRKVSSSSSRLQIKYRST